MSEQVSPERTGILLVDKPGGWTSHDVVGKVRRLLGQRRVGHTGTLDPRATGLLVVCVGRATRLAEYIGAQEKYYEGEIQLGARTTTDDSEGEVLETAPVPSLEGALLRQLERRFTGLIDQRPPAFSAVRIRGERAYAAARRGALLNLPARRVRVCELALRASGPQRLRIRVRCGQGTYVRSLARDVGEMLGCGGHLAELRRIRVGPSSVSEAFTPEELTALADAGRLADAVAPLDQPLSGMDAVLLPRRLATQLSHGSEIRATTARPAERARVYAADGEFVAIASVASNGAIRPLKVLCSAS